jgi:soluble P-type ATPase
VASFFPVQESGIGTKRHFTAMHHCAVMISSKAGVPLQNSRGANGEELSPPPHQSKTATRESPMMKQGIQIDIPGFRKLDIRAVCSDYTGTLSLEGELISGVKSRLRKLARLVDIYVLTSDTRGSAKIELQSIPLNPIVVEGQKHDVEKRNYLRKHLKANMSQSSEMVAMIDCGCVKSVKAEVLRLRLMWAKAAQLTRLKTPTLLCMGSLML